MATQVNTNRYAITGSPQNLLVPTPPSATQGFGKITVVGKRILELYDTYFEIPSTILRLARWGGNSLKLFIPKLKDVDVLGSLRLLSFFDLPSNVRDVGLAAWKFVKVRPARILTQNEKWDVFLRIIGKVGAFFDNLATGTIGLGAVGAFMASNMAWLDPMLGVGILLEGAFLIRGVKHGYESYKLRREIKPLFKKREWDGKTLSTGFHAHTLEKVVSILEKKRAVEHSIFRKHFNVNGTDFLEKLKGLVKVSTHDIHNPTTEHKAHMVYKAINTQLKNNVRRQIIGTIAFIVSLVGISILVGVPPLAPIGFALMFLGGVINMVNSYIFKRLHTDFENSINEHCDPAVSLSDLLHS